MTILSLPLVLREFRSSNLRFTIIVDAKTEPDDLVRALQRQIYRNFEVIILGEQGTLDGYRLDFDISYQSEKHFVARKALASDIVCYIHSLQHWNNPLKLVLLSKEYRLNRVKTINYEDGDYFEDTLDALFIVKAQMFETEKWSHYSDLYLQYGCPRFGAGALDVRSAIQTFIENSCTNDSEKLATFNRVVAWAEKSESDLRGAEPKTFAIYVPCNDYYIGRQWGDYHLGKSIVSELFSAGYRATLVCFNQWKSSSRFDFSLTIHGTHTNPFCEKDALRILWIISHPEKIRGLDIDSYDRVLIASQTMTEKYRSIFPDKNIDFLPQFSTMVPQTKEVKHAAHDVLFVGNSRNVFRESVRYASELDIDFAVYGDNWNKFLPAKFIKGKFLHNELLGTMYGSAKIVLNDHWKEMKENGFVNNRIYDVISAGGFVISDYFEEIDNQFEGLLVTYSDFGEFENIVNYYLANEDVRLERAEALQDLFGERFTPAAAVENILSGVEARE
ncbi:glycosyltransferase [Candidatus Litorirhabdus singularis]|uniref:glycosyltransferase n=1 Tax=Candidatus Litorirhabdus singularis TaxID=2518993 RepID=UPI00243208C3|nr:glycosyltransferase [Candidatus Litorirhabdus singularis]